MKPEEAILWIEDTKYIYENMNPDIELSKLKCEAFNLAIQALAKQISKSTLSRIESLGNHRYELFNDCPSCKVDLRQVVKSDYLSKYCPECGQNVRWK